LLPAVALGIHHHLELVACHQRQIQESEMMGIYFRSLIHLCITLNRKTGCLWVL
jgi:hypothetical protein